MKIVLSTLKKILFWSYDRGTWPYDLMCVLILAFIFLTPNLIFRTKRTGPFRSAPAYVSSEEIADDGPGQLEEKVARALTKKLGHEVRVLRIEPVSGSGSMSGYLVWEK